MNRLFVLLLCTVFSFSACNKETVNISSFNMELLTYTGMCGTILLKVDSINTQLDSTKLTCNSNKQLINLKTSEEKYNRIKQYISTLNLMKFKNTSCDRCVDGVDYIFKLTVNGKYNEFSIPGSMSGEFPNKEKFKELLLLINTFNKP